MCRILLLLILASLVSASAQTSLVLFCESVGEIGHDFLVGNKPREKKDSSLRRALLFLDDGGFQAAAARGNQIRSLAIAPGKYQPETCGAKKDSGDGACGFS